MLPVKRIELVRMAEVSADEKLEMAREFFLSGNISEVARNHRVYQIELMDLTRQVWFMEEVRNLDREATTVTRAKLTRLFDTTIDELEDRLKHGDTVIGMEGQSFKVPLKAKDLASIAKVVFDTKKELDGSYSGLGSSESKRLRDLAAALRAVPVDGSRLTEKEKEECIVLETINDMNFIERNELEA